LSVVARTFKVRGVVAPILSRIVIVTDVSAITLFASTEILNAAVAEPETAGAGSTTALLVPVVYGAVPPVIVNSTGTPGNTSAAVGKTERVITGGVGGTVGVVLAVPLPPQETSNELIAPNKAMKAARFAQLPVLLKKVLIATAVSF